MGAKKLGLSLLLAFFAISCVASDHPFKSASEEELFRNFTFSICIGAAYEGASEKMESNVAQAANGYREYSNISLEAYEEARSIVNKWIKKDYSSKHGGQVEIMKCIDLYNHIELKQIFEKYNPCKSPDDWFDKDDYKLRCQ